MLFVSECGSAACFWCRCSRDTRRGALCLGLGRFQQHRWKLAVRTHVTAPRRAARLACVSRLFHGNFVLDSPVPQKLLYMCANLTEREFSCEFSYMRYSTATSYPNDFKYSGFTLRQVDYDPLRRTELFIVKTMYNEDEEVP